MPLTQEACFLAALSQYLTALQSQNMGLVYFERVRECVVKQKASFEALLIAGTLVSRGIPRYGKKNILEA